MCYQNHVQFTVWQHKFIDQTISNHICNVQCAIGEKHQYRRHVALKTVAGIQFENLENKL